VQTCIWPSWCHCHSLSLASVKSRLVLPFWYQLTRVVPDKGPVNGCVCVLEISSTVIPTPSMHHEILLRLNYKTTKLLNKPTAKKLDLSVTSLHTLIHFWLWCYINRLLTYSLAVQLPSDDSVALPTSSHHMPLLPHGCYRCRPISRAAIDRYLLVARLTAANLP